MKLFSEINSVYYNITERILRKRRVTKADILEAVKRYGFSETVLFLEPQLTGRNGYGLLTESGEVYESVLKKAPDMPLTLLEKRWLCAVLDDKKSSLFLDREQKDALRKLLGCTPLFDVRSVCFFDRYTNGDDYEDEQYIKHFRDIVRAHKEKRLIKISFNTRKNNRITHYYLIEKLEYSSKNDRFRVYAVGYSGNAPVERVIINLSQVITAELTDMIPDSFMNDETAKNELSVRVSSERNAINRFMMEFAELERVSEYDEDSRECIVTMRYDPRDETEILIRILSFGPVAEVIAPDEFRRKIAERVKAQNDMLGV